jgi:hypothetical protein
MIGSSYTSLGLFVIDTAFATSAVGDDPVRLSFGLQWGGVKRIGILFGLLVAGCHCGFALNPSLEISEYGHDAWTVRSGFIKGNIYTIAQTADGYLWLGTEFGLFRFDGVRPVQWQPLAGQHLPSAVFRLLGARDGTLWIGTFAGLVTWSGGKLTRRPEMDGQVVGSLLEQGARQGHWGLPGVRERAKRIGARLKLWSEPGAGTEAELTVPARIAYRTVHRREGLRLFRRTKVQS